MRRLRLILGIVLAVVVSFTVITLLALEGHEVVVIRTFDAQGQGRETRTWVADEDGYAWIEAANADRPFLLQLQADPEVELRRGGVVHHCHAAAMPNPQGHERIRRLLAANYGWADAWIGMLTDTSGSLAVRLECR